MTCTEHTCEATSTETERVLADMLLENTGRHMLDSGGAYGRSWERNRAAAKDVEPVDWLRARPEVVQNVDVITLDVFHYLRERVEYAAKLDRAWRTYVENDTRFGTESRYYNGCSTADGFCEAMAAKGWLEDGKDLAGWTNTYNGEDALSQVLQYRTFYLQDSCPWSENYDADSARDYAPAWQDGEYYVLLSIHGGCDVRGGYTDLRAFHVGDYDAMCELYDNARFMCGCQVCGYYADTYDAGCTWDGYTREGNSVEGNPSVPSYRGLRKDFGCPQCGSSLAFYPWPIG